MPWSYSVLDPVSQAYPKVQGRSPTCYSPVRHSSTPKGLSVRLACVKHAASVRPEPGSNSPNKNPQPQPGRIRIRKIRSQTTDTKTGIQKNNNHTHKQEDGESPHRHGQQTKTTKHTIEFSNNRLAVLPRARDKSSASSAAGSYYGLSGTICYQVDSRGGLALSGSAGSL